MDKHEVARYLEEIGILLELKGEHPFKVRAYHNAARIIESVTNLESIIQEEKLTTLPGIGHDLALKISTLVETGSLPYYEELKKTVPEGLLELLKIPGLGSKKIKALYEQLGIKSIEALTKACKKGEVAPLRGFGVKTEENILQGIYRLKTHSKRLLWWEATGIALSILDKLSSLKEVKKVEIGGSVRRKCETCGDLDFIAATSHPKVVMDWFTSQPWVEKVISHGQTKSSIFLKQGIQADLRIVPEEQFAFALMYFTGSKEHSIHIRHLANTLGYTLNEYGLAPLEGGGPSKKLLTEEKIYKALGLNYIPPELRENMGEIEAALEGTLPKLVEEKDIRGVFHCHTTDSDGHNTLEEMVEAAQALKWEYIGISDHSKSSYQANGLDESKLFDQIERIQKLNRSKKFSTYVFAGLECDILTDGKLDFPDHVLKELDFIIISIHRSFQMDEKTMTARLIKAIENPYTTMVGHLTGRLLLRREPYALNTSKVIDACIANQKIMELNANPMRLDMDWRLWHKASEKGLKCCINPDAHNTTDLQYIRAGINCARKGWLRKQDVINTLPLAKMQANFEKLPLGGTSRRS